MILLIACSTPDAPPAAPQVMGAPPIVDPTAVTQEAVRLREHVVLRGEFAAPCEAGSRVDVIDVATRALLSTIEVPAGGASWEIAVPKVSGIMLGGMCDADGNGILGSAGDRILVTALLDELSPDEPGPTLSWTAVVSLPGAPGAPPVPGS